eukprot:PhF_6_TR21166/c0_g1_i2/m.30493
MSSQKKSAPTKDVKKGSSDIEDISTIGFEREELKCGCETLDQQGTLDMLLTRHVIVSTQLPFSAWDSDASNVTALGKAVSSNTAATSPKASAKPKPHTSTTDLSHQRDEGKKHQKPPKSTNEKRNCIYAPDLPEGTVMVFDHQPGKQLTVSKYLTVEDFVAHRPQAAEAGGKQGNVYIFVCAHTQRDSRCAYCGPILIQQIQQQVVERSSELKGKSVQVFAINHIGGHKYAGNVIVYEENGQGYWYGYVCPSDVTAIVDAVCSEGSVVGIPHKLRGLTAVAPEIQKETIQKIIASEKAKPPRTTLVVAPKTTVVTSTSVVERPSPSLGLRALLWVVFAGLCTLKLKGNNK